MGVARWQKWKSGCPRRSWAFGTAGQSHYKCVRNNWLRVKNSIPSHWWLLPTSRLMFIFFLTYLLVVKLFFSFRYKSLFTARKALFWFCKFRLIFLLLLDNDFYLLSDSNWILSQNSKCAAFIWLLPLAVVMFAPDLCAPCYWNRADVIAQPVSANGQIVRGTRSCKWTGITVQQFSKDQASCTRYWLLLSTMLGNDVQLWLYWKKKTTTTTTTTTAAGQLEIQWGKSWPYIFGIDIKSRAAQDASVEYLYRYGRVD